MTTWFTSDLHFGHKNIIKYCSRPWASTKDMDQALIDNWNSVVKPEDEVWNLGDVGFTCKAEYLRDCLHVLNGTHHVIRGNHDGLLVRLDGMGAVSLHDVVIHRDSVEEIKLYDQEITLCHYAMREWHHALRGTWHLFGHTHALLPPFGKSVDVGVDNAWRIIGGKPDVQSPVPPPNGADWLPLSTLALRGDPATYRPVSFAELKAYMDRLSIGPHAEFGAGFVPSSEEPLAIVDDRKTEDAPE